MKTKKLKSGNWNIKVFSHYDENGKQINVSFTAPSRAEAEKMAANFKADRKRRAKLPDPELTVRGCIKKYIDLSQTLSPTTLRAYRRILEYAFPSLMDVPVKKLTHEMMQQAVNNECRRKTERTGKPLSPKTIKNEYALLAAALKSEGMLFMVKLPRVQHKNEDLPEPEIIIKAIEGTKAELPGLLAMWCGLRLSEIRGLTKDSIKRDCIFIDKVLVDTDEGPILKYYAKTDSSIRKVIMPNYIKSLIKSQKWTKNGLLDDYIVPMSRSEIYYHFQEAIKPTEIEMSFHDLRHEYTSIMLTKLSIPPKIVQDDGGWHTDATMKRTYSQSFSKSRVEAAQKRDAYFESIL